MDFNECSYCKKPFEDGDCVILNKDRTSAYHAKIDHIHKVHVPNYVTCEFEQLKSEEDFPDYKSKPWRIFYHGKLYDFDSLKKIAPEKILSLDVKPNRRQNGARIVGDLSDLA